MIDTGRFQPRFMRGASLLDELTAVVVLSAGLLGLAGLQGRVQNLAANAQTQTIALTLAQSRLERLRGLADEPGGSAGYEPVTDSRETVAAIGDQHLDAPITLRVDVARFRLQGAEPARYAVADASAAVDPGVPEFKRVTVTASWTSRG